MFKTIRYLWRVFTMALLLGHYRVAPLLAQMGMPWYLRMWLYTVPPTLSRRSLEERMSMAVERLGPSFIKLGQTLSTRADIIGVEMAVALSRLQDKLPPFDSIQARRIIERELEQPVETLFTGFGETPVAAASIAQVHKAQLQDGSVVAVKILRPGIERRMKADIGFFYWIARLVERAVPHSRRLRLVESVRTFEKNVMHELDLRMEAAAASELRDNMQGDPHIRVPQIHWAYTSRRVMVMEWMDGVSIYDHAALHAQGHDLKTIASHLAVTFFNQAYRDGFFHADVHPGNVLVGEKGEIILLDFGIMGRLDSETRLYVAEILRGFITRDYHAVAEIHFKAGYVPSHYAKGDFALACRAIGEPIIGLPAQHISVGRLLAHLFAVTKQFEMTVQPQLLLLQKTTLVVEGVGATLDPRVNLWKLAEPWIEEWAIDNIGIEARLKRAAVRIWHALDQMPDVIAQGARAPLSTGIITYPSVTSPLRLGVTLLLVACSALMGWWIGRL